MLKKIRNAFLMLVGTSLLMFTHFVYFDPLSAKSKEQYQELFGECYEPLPYFSIPIGLILMLFGFVSSLATMFGSLDSAPEDHS